MPGGHCPGAMYYGIFDPIGKDIDVLCRHENYLENQAKNFTTKRFQWRSLDNHSSKEYFREVHSRIADIKKWMKTVPSHYCPKPQYRLVRGGEYDLVERRVFSFKESARTPCVVPQDTQG